MVYFDIKMQGMDNFKMSIMQFTHAIHSEGSVWLETDCGLCCFLLPQT